MDDLSQQLHLHIASLRRYAMALIRDPVEADDLVQESLQFALAYIRKGREIKNLRAYLFAILHNVQATRYRRPGSNDEHVSIEDVAGQLSIAPNQQDRVELNSLLRAVNELPCEQREVLLLVSLEGLRYREAAEVLGIPVGTVMSRLSRARKALQDKLDMDGTTSVRRVDQHAGPAKGEPRTVAGRRA